MPDMKPKEDEFLNVNHSAMPFSVPKGYFDALPVRITHQLSNPKRSVFQREWFPRWAAAASFAVMSLCAILFFFKAPKQMVSAELAAEAQTYEEVLEEEGVLEYVNDEEFIVQFDAELAALYPAPQSDTVATEIEEMILTDDLDELELYLEL